MPGVWGSRPRAKLRLWHGGGGGGHRGGGEEREQGQGRRGRPPVRGPSAAVGEYTAWNTGWPVGSGPWLQTTLHVLGSCCEVSRPDNNKTLPRAACGVAQNSLALGWPPPSREGPRTADSVCCRRNPALKGQTPQATGGTTGVNTLTLSRSFFFKGYNEIRIRAEDICNLFH